MGEPSRREQNQPCGSANADVEGAHRRDHGRTNRPASSRRWLTPGPPTPRGCNAIQTYAFF